MIYLAGFIIYCLIGLLMLRHVSHDVAAAVIMIADDRHGFSAWIAFGCLFAAIVTWPLHWLLRRR